MLERITSDNSELTGNVANRLTLRGIELLEESTPASLESALKHFDSAIALREPLLANGDVWIRYGLAAGWMNRADALTRLGGREVGEAVRSYDRAITLIQHLPMGENSLFPRRHAIAWMNRGLTLQVMEAFAESIDSLERALAILDEKFSETIEDRELLLAGVWLNIAIGAVGMKNPERAIDSAREALDGISLTESGEIASAEIGLKARHVLCQALSHRIGRQEPSEIDPVFEATEFVEEGLALCSDWADRGESRFDTISRDLFHFGCRVYQKCQPQFLSEFILENFRDAGMRPAALDSLWREIQSIQREGFNNVNTPRFQTVLSRVRALCEVESRVSVSS